MDIGFLQIHRDKTLYLQIYQGFKKAIEQNFLQAGEQMPSIRSLANSLSVSKVTIEKAYDQLYSEGYIEKHNRAPYTIAAISFPSWEAKAPIASPIVFSNKNFRAEPKYNFSSGEMDEDGFDFSLWRRYVTRALEEENRLIRYGNVQGEYELRSEIASYLFRSRGVKAHPEQILIGANAQVLLGVLCSLLEPKSDFIAFEDPGFMHGRQVFENYGFSIAPLPMKETGLDLTKLKKGKANIAYTSPSHQFPTGLIMPIAQRTKLLQWANESSRLIIEDDYDSEFRYYGNPIPALKGLDHQDKVVYLGSFSKILPPSIRVSYMLLPVYLMERFHSMTPRLNQSASTMEQLSLAYFMEDGLLERQIRRLRKHYADKREAFITLLEKHFGNKVSVYKNQSGLFVVMKVHSNATVATLKKKAEEQGCHVAAISDYSVLKSSDPRLLLYFSSIPLQQMEDAVKALAKAWKSL